MLVTAMTEPTGTGNDPNYNLRLGYTVKETKMNLEQNYEASKAKPKVPPRPIAGGDVLQEVCSGDYFLVEAYESSAATFTMYRVKVKDGLSCAPSVSVPDSTALTRAEADQLCDGYLENFRLVGRAKDVLVVKEPGE